MSQKKSNYHGASRTRREPKEFEEYMLQLNRVTRVVKGGRRMRFQVTMVVGNRTGRVGLGIGKGNDTQIAVRKAVQAAKKNIIEVPIVNDTIPHEFKFKFKAARILVLPASAGTGIIAGGAVRKILELAGVKNVLSKSFGTNNRIVVGQATIKLLAELRMTEAAKKFLIKLKKEKSTVQQKKVAAQSENMKVGKSKVVGSKNLASKPKEVAVKKSVTKAQAT